MPNDEDIWIEAQSKHAEDYLREQRVEHLGVGEGIRRFMCILISPFGRFSQSIHRVRLVGGAVTGDLPANYISGSEGSHPREAMRAFARHWQEASGFMLRGESHPDYHIGTPDQWPQLGDLLKRRAEIIKRYANDDGIWTETVA